MDAGYTWLKSIADRMNAEVAAGAAPRPEQVTVRQLLSKFSYQRRSQSINNHIRDGLERFKLRTDKEVASASTDSPIMIGLDSDSDDAPAVPRTKDPTHRISTFLKGKPPLLSVKPESLLREATTIMQMNHYSRLPVMKNERDVAGILTWKSIGECRALGIDCTHVRQCMEKSVEVISADTRLFDAIHKVAEHGQVLVRGKDERICGIVTATDVANVFEKLARPFLLIGEIERHMRNLLHGKFTLDQLKAASADGRSIKGLSDLTFAEYRGIFGNKDNWERLGLDIHRREFIKNLEAVQEIRNEVAHFNPKGLDDGQRRTIRNVARFFDRVVRMTSAGKATMTNL